MIDYGKFQEYHSGMLMAWGKKLSLSVIGLIVIIIAVAVWLLWPSTSLTSAELIQKLTQHRWCDGLTDAEIEKLRHENPSVFSFGTGDVSFEFEADGTYAWFHDTDAIGDSTSGKGLWNVTDDGKIHMQEVKRERLRTPANEADYQPYETFISDEGSILVKPAYRHEIVIYPCGLRKNVQ